MYTQLIPSAIATGPAKIKNNKAPDGLKGSIKIISGIDNIKTFKNNKVLDITLPVFKSIIVKINSAGSCNMFNIFFIILISILMIHFKKKNTTHQILFIITLVIFQKLRIIDDKHPKIPSKINVIKYHINLIKFFKKFHKIDNNSLKKVHTLL